MHILIGKKQIVLASLVAALSLAVFVNWYYTDSGKRLRPEGQTPAGGEENKGAAVFTSAEEVRDYFDGLRLTRESRDAAALEELEAVAAAAVPGSDEASLALSALSSYTERIRCRNDIEDLVGTSVGCPCLAVVSETGVDVVLAPSDLTEQNVLAVSDVIRSVVGGKYEDLRVCAAVGASSLPPALRLEETAAENAGESEETTAAVG